MQYAKKFALMSVIAVTAATMLFTACKKKESEEDIGFASDQAVMEKTYDDAQNIGDEAYAATGNSMSNFKTTGTTMGGCATITKDLVNHKVTISFDGNCTCMDGKVRSGDIIITFTGQYADPGSVHSITFNNFYVSGNHVEGTKTVTNMGNNTSGQPYFYIDIDGKITLANNAGTITWSASRQRTWTDGYTTLGNWSDDKYEIVDRTTVGTTLTRANGTTVTNKILSPVIVDLSCQFKFVQGTIEHTVSTGKTALLDFGNGTCDNTATVTINGKTRTITKP